MSIEEKKSRDTVQYERLLDIMAALRAPDGCPWDREQTHESLKDACIEEACEVVCGINIYRDTNNPENMLEELGDLLLQVVMHAQIAKEEGLFDMEDVCRVVSDKMVRRHPHVFGDVSADTSSQVLVNWDKIKKSEKSGKEWMDDALPAAFEESKLLIDKAVRRKEEKKKKQIGR